MNPFVLACAVLSKEKKNTEKYTFLYEKVHNATVLFN